MEYEEIDLYKMEVNSLGFTRDPLLAMNNYEIPPRYYKITSCLNPIDPALLTKEVSSKLESYGSIVATKTPQMIRELCMGFNQCIELNQNNEMPQKMIFSPKTGSAKSLSAKLYITLLKEETSLIIVNTVDEAITYCKDINNWRNEVNYAMCYYRITADNPESDVLINKEDIAIPKCLVITHAMFKTIHKFNETNVSKKLQERRDPLVIIDERLSLYNSYDFSDEQIDNLIELLSKIKNHTTRYSLDETIKLLNDIKEYFNLIPTFIPETNKYQIYGLNKKDLFFINNEYYSKLEIPETFNFSVLEKLLKDESLTLTQIHNSLINKKSAIQENAYRENIKKLIENISKVLTSSFFFSSNGKIKRLASIETLYGMFNSFVVLDATATINRMYEDSSYYDHMNFMHFETTDSKDYSSLTIYKASNILQSRSSIFKNKPAKEVKETAKAYIKIANTILTEKDDKLLIITYKGFRSSLEQEINDLNIVCTHWGNHVGKNEWSDCNKIMVIGWNHLTDSTLLSNYIHAVGGQEIAEKRISSSTIELYKKAQLVDDLVQGTMRGSARKILSTDGNCYKSEVYIFVANKKSEIEVFESFTKEFTNAKVIDWKPEMTNTIKKKTSPEEKADNIIKYLDNLKGSCTDVLQKDVEKALEIPNSSFDRIIKSEYFKDLLKKRNYQYKKKDGKSNAFYL